ncbi:hypothetical protein MRS76_19325 [Rhizobiaceae bacterium n13]|uniref:hypothetical protein n=1 Tax=Ferirhizobium litorale TaxID=2927786 RepID=UPI0024B2BC94|nr:hypothetical protein [Fererhizobium litorale]MDI7864104.1 hypothetical protein [Fererhizobium litorale]
MTRITLEHIDSIFDCSAAITLAAEILDGGRDIPAALAESIRRVLLNSQNQLYPVWDVLEQLHSEQERVVSPPTDESAPIPESVKSELEVWDEISSLKQRLDTLVQSSLGGSK